MIETQRLEIRVPSTVLGKLDADKVCHCRLKWYRPVAVAITENARGEILLIRPTKGGSWCFPQGGIEQSEGIIDGLVRELYEETGIEVSEVCSFCHIDLLDTPDRSRDGFAKGKRYYYFHVRCRGNPRLTPRLEEICAYQWLPPRGAIGVIKAIGENQAKKRNSMLTAIRNSIE